MAFKYLPHTEADIKEMLKVCGVNSLEDLYAEIPEDLKLKHEYGIPSSKSEIEVRHLFEDLGKQNKPLICFGGSGAYDHYAPSVIKYILERSEFLTSYTPYQAEISQGTLQYIYEYQTMMADLTGMDISNASLYDGATATAEAMLMMVAASKKKNKVLVSATINPNSLDVVKTYAKFHGIELVVVEAQNGLINKDIIQQELETESIAGVIVAQPNYYGLIEDFTGLADLCHQHKALLTINSDPSTLAILKKPGEWGADIAVGDCQTLGIPLCFGGPYLGYMCVKKELVRKMPGRIVGGTTDANGNRAFVLTMQAREQHIRREKATSNICSNQGMMTLYVSIYLSLMGIKGLKEINELSYGGAHYLFDQLIKTGKFSVVYDAPFLKEFCLRTTLDIKTLNKKMVDNGFLCGIPVKGTTDCLLFAVTEKRSKSEIDKMISLI